jgi:hypothetical protein
MARLGPARLNEIHATSAGIPARLHALLDAWLRGPGAEAAGSAAAAGEPEQRRLAPRPSEPRAVAAARKEALRAALPSALRGMLARLEAPRTQLALAALCIIAIAGLWYFALERGSGMQSVGVPVQRFELPPVATPPTPDVAAPSPEPAAAPASEAPTSRRAPRPAPTPAEGPSRSRRRAVRTRGRLCSKRRRAGRPEPRDGEAGEPALARRQLLKRSDTATRAIARE